MMQGDPAVVLREARRISILGLVAKVLGRGFWIAFVAAMAVYATMLLWSLPKVASLAGGLPPFDMRPGGYTFDEAHEFLAALDPSGAAFYRDVQQRLDLAYPVLISATVFLGLAALAPASWGAARWLLACTALPIAPFDYLENAAVARMLALGKDGITPPVVEAASRWTVLKSASTTVAMSLLMLLFLLWLVRRMKSRAAQHQA